MNIIQSRRALLAGAPVAAAAALAGGTVANAVAISMAKADGLDWPAIVLRAAEVTDKLRKYYGPDWTSADQEAAAGVLKYCRDRGAGLPDDETAWKATLEFFWDYGQSLDWAIYGDPASMIAKSAARSPRGRPTWAVEIDPIFEMIEKHKASCDTARSISDACGDLPFDDPDREAGSERFREAFKGAYKELGALLTSQPTTVAGCIAMLAHVSQKDWIFGDDSPQTILTDAYESDVEEAQAFSKHLADALRNIVERGQA